MPQSTMPSLTQLCDQMQVTLDQLRAAVSAPPSSPPPFYTASTSRNIYLKPALPSFGLAGSVFPDPTYGNRILRVTDGVLRPGRSYDAPSNTHTTAWSADSSRFFVWGPDGPLQFSFDAATLSAHRLALLPSQCEPAYSRLDRNIAYGVGGGYTRTLLRYTLDPFSTTVMLDVDTLGLPALMNPRTYIGGILVGGDPERVAIFYGGQSQGGHYLVNVIMPNGTMRTINTVQRCDCHLHSLGISLDGRYVALYPNNAQPCQVIFWDLDTDTLANETVAQFGHDALGYELQTNMCPLDGSPWDARQWVLRSLHDIDHPSNIISPVLLPQEVYTADHQSWNHARPDRRMPFISSTFRTAAGMSAPWLPWIDEILGVATDGSGTVYRFAHHRSDPSDGFWSQPIIHVAPSGRHAIFSSNMEKSLGLDTNEGGHRNDVFLVELL